MRLHQRIPATEISEQGIKNAAGLDKNEIQSLKMPSNPKLPNLKPQYQHNILYPLLS